MFMQSANASRVKKFADKDSCDSACVNLARNKSALLEQNLLDKVLPYAVSPMSTVVFKLLGTLRMAVDGQSK